MRMSKMNMEQGRKATDKNLEYSLLPLSREQKITMNWLKRNRPATALYIRDKRLEAAREAQLKLNDTQGKSNETTDGKGTDQRGPETSRGGDVCQPEAQGAGAQEDFEMSREEKIKMNYLKQNSPMTALYHRDKLKQRQQRLKGVVQ